MPNSSKDVMTKSLYHHVLFSSWLTYYKLCETDVISNCNILWSPNRSLWAASCFFRFIEEIHHVTINHLCMSLRPSPLLFLSQYLTFCFLHTHHMKQKSHSPSHFLHTSIYCMPCASHVQQLLYLSFLSFLGSPSDCDDYRSFGKLSGIPFNLLSLI
jgi:hypothetical protein